MIAELHIPIDNEAVLAFWKAQAQQHGHSLEEEIGLLLSKTASKNGLAKRLSGLREKIKAECGILPDCIPLIREDRDA